MYEHKEKGHKCRQNYSVFLDRIASLGLACLWSYLLTVSGLTYLLTLDLPTYLLWTYACLWSYLGVEYEHAGVDPEVVVVGSNPHPGVVGHDGFFQSPPAPWRLCKKVTQKKVRTCAV